MGQIGPMSEIVRVSILILSQKSHYEFAFRYRLTLEDSV